MPALTLPPGLLIYSVTSSSPSLAKNSNCATSKFATSSSTWDPRRRMRSFKRWEITDIDPVVVSTVGMRTGRGFGGLSRRRGSTIICLFILEGF